MGRAAHANGGQAPPGNQGDLRRSRQHQRERPRPEGIGKLPGNRRHPTHQRVESGGDICPPIDRLGPFDTEEEASHALEKAEQRNEEWDNDPDWNDSDLED